MASFNWLLWNQILLFEELSGGNTWKRICRGRSESVRGGASPGGGCLLQRLLEGQIRERKEIWAVWLLLERRLQRSLRRGAFVWFFLGEEKERRSFRLRKVVGCLAWEGLTEVCSVE